MSVTSIRTLLVLQFFMLMGLGLETAQQGTTGADLFARVWDVRDGLGPFVNGRSCSGCHASPRAGGSGTDERSLVAVVPASGQILRRFRLSKDGAVDEQLRPQVVVLRKAPSLFGSGVLEALPVEEIAAGVVDRGRMPLGKFGWKGHLRDIEVATTAAFENELGLVHPEISEAQINATVAFIRSLSPLTSNAPSRNREGQALFTRLGCATCHRPSFPSIEHRNLFPYTDLLLHDMGPSLADGVAQGSASGQEFRTPPLWGLAQTGPPYLHDGRAKTLHDAIAGHGGEGEPSAWQFQKLDADERRALLDFIRSL